MSFETDFLSMMKDEVTIEPWLSMDRDNRPSFGAAVTYRARIAGKAIALRQVFGEQSTVIFDVYVNSNGARITVNDRLTLPADQTWVDHTPVIFAVGNYTDEDSTHHCKLQCGWMYHRQGQ